MFNDVATTPTSIADLVRSVAIHVGTKSQFARFKRMYSHDRIAFVYDCLPSFARTMALYQEEILGYFDEGHNRVSIRGPHGLGKTALASILTQHSVLTAETDCKVPTTASAWRQLEKYLWPEIKKTARFLDWVEIGRGAYTRDEALQMSIRLNGGIVEAFAVASDDHTTIEGAHATRMVYIFDESKTIPRATWDAAEGAFSSEGLTASDYERGIAPSIAVGNKSDSGNDVRKGAISSIPQGDYIGGNSNGVNSSSKENNSQHVTDRYVNAPSVYSRESMEGEQSGLLNGSREHGIGPLPQLGLLNAPTPAALNGSELLLPTSRSQSIAPSRMLSDNRASSSIESTSDTVYEALAFAISTPGDPTGQFYDIHMHKPGYEDWLTRHVTIDEAIAAGRISPKWVAQRAIQWGVDSSVYQNRVLGEFADETEEGVIPLSWIRAANHRWLDWEKKGFPVESGAIEILGVDVAGGGEDKTVIAHRSAWGVSRLHIYSKLQTPATAGHVKSLCAGKKVHIEMDGGLGASVYAILKEQDIKGLVPITVGASTHWRDRSGEISFLNVRAAMWWNMRELLDPTYNSQIMLPPLEQLTLDLSTPHSEMMKDATRKIESKDSIAKKIGRSTDYGDSVCLAFWGANRGGGVVF